MESIINPALQEVFKPNPELSFDPFAFGLVSALCLRFPLIYEIPLLGIADATFSGFAHQLTAYLAFRMVPTKYHSIIGPLLMGSFTFIFLRKLLKRMHKI